MEISSEIRKRRLALGCTLETLSEQTGLTKGYLSKLERSGKAPPFATLEKIAVALKCGLGSFLETTSAQPKIPKISSANIELIHRGQTGGPISSNLGYDYTPLLREYRGKYMAPFLLEIRRGETKDFTHDGEEFVYVLEGRVALLYEGRSHNLEAGEGFYLDSRIRHRFRGRGAGTARLLAVNFNYRRF